MSARFKVIVAVACAVAVAVGIWFGLANRKANNGLVVVQATPSVSISEAKTSSPGAEITDPADDPNHANVEGYYTPDPTPSGADPHGHDPAVEKAMGEAATTNAVAFVTAFAGHASGWKEAVKPITDPYLYPTVAAIPDDNIPDLGTVTGSSVANVSLGHVTVDVETSSKKVIRCEMTVSPDNAWVVTVYSPR